MYILKNALVSIKRNKTRNILIAIIFIVIAASTSIALAILNTSNKLIDSYNESYDVEATIKMNRKNFMKDMNESTKEDKKEAYSNIAALTEEEIINYASSDYVKDYYYTYSVSMDSDDIEKTSSSSDAKSSIESRGPGGMSRESQKEESGDFKLVGYSSISSIKEFIDGNYKVVSGSINDGLNENEIAINEELASTNDLEVGDTITLYNSDNSKLTYTFTIVAIYSDESSDSENSMDMFSKSSNQIITCIDTVKNIVSDDEDIKTSVNPTYILTSKDVIEKFESELSEKGLNENFTISTNISDIESQTSSITNVKTFAKTMLIITFVIGGVILFILNMINVRERKYEIGVLRTIGMKKSLLSLQFITEILVVAIISLVIGLGVGAASSVKISNQLLSSEIESSKEKIENVENNFGGPQSDKKNDKFSGVVTVNEIDSIDAVVDYKVIIELLGVSLLLVIISGSSAMVSIQRFSPLTILKERS